MKDPARTEAYLQVIERQALLGGRFSNIKRIRPDGGGGAFSLICFARDEFSGEDVVLKFFHPDSYTPSETYRWDSFQRESQLLATFSGCRDVVRLVCPQSSFDFQPDPTLLWSIPFSYYALEKAELGSFDDVIASDAWKAEELLSAVHDVARALQRVHSLGIAHRDLKPGNCLLTRTGVKLSDFGTARNVSDQATALLPVYTGPPGDQRYVAPEMMACLHDVDPRIAYRGDFFALGAIIFEAFTGVNLGVRLFGPSLLTDLTQVMSPVARASRIQIFDQIAGNIAAKYPLPALESLNPGIQPCIRQRLNKLYQELCQLDYRRRLFDFSAVFRGLETCRLILKNETAYATWLREKQKRRQIRLDKRNGVFQ